MLPQKHSQPKYIEWCKNILVVFAFAFPVYIVLTTMHRVELIDIIMLFFMPIPILIGAYFFSQDVWTDEEGLFIELLWRKIRVPWVDIIEIKSAWGFWHAPGKNHILIVLVNGLTPFHRLFGVLYGWSLKPGFIIYPTIRNYEELKSNIENHIKQLHDKL